MKFTVKIILAVLLFHSCTNPLKNELALSPSLYLQQHAKDPVNWQIWSGNIWEQAKEQHKLVLISIGYSACHWCHVMQHESFQNPKIAELMNRHYILVKIDREQQPNIDAFYAKKQEELTGWAGWPMHIILNHKQEIIWTGIYKKPKKWKSLISRIASEYAQNPEVRFIDEAKKAPSKQIVAIINFDSINAALYTKLDTTNGGLIPTRYQRKYPNTSLFNYLLLLYKTEHDRRIGNFLQKTAKAMALGGINDQIEDGFFRFAMDQNWHIPHFEKMLYTNAKLIGFYANMYRVFGDSLYLNTAIETASFVSQKLHTSTALYFGSLNADQITEGSYYTYKANELKRGLNNNFELAKAYYNLNPSWIWEGSYHLNRSFTDTEFAERENIPLLEWEITKQQIIKKLTKLRKSKQKPTIDPKLISSWNAMFLDAVIELYSITKNERYINMAKQIGDYFVTKFEADKTIKHYYLTNKKSDAQTFPEDLLYTAKALRSLGVHLPNKTIYSKVSAKLTELYLTNRANFLRFPFDDRTMPSIKAIELQFPEAIRSYRVDYRDIIQNPENHGSLLQQLYKTNQINSK